MDKRGRWVKVPDIPLPTPDVSAHPKVGVFINREWAAALLSLVQHADQLTAWESDDLDRIEINAYELFGIIHRATGMIGAIIPYVSTTNPPGTLPCNGSEYPRSEYPALYDALHENYQRPGGLFAGEDSFVTPDFRGRFILAAATTDPYMPFTTGGEEKHALTVEELAAHSHTNQPHQHSYTQPTFGVDIESVGVPDPTGVGNPPVPMGTGMTNVIIDDTGSNEPHNNMPPYIALNYAIVCY